MIRKTFHTFHIRNFVAFIKKYDLVWSNQDFVTVLTTFSSGLTLKKELSCFLKN